MNTAPSSIVRWGCIFFLCAGLPVLKLPPGGFSLAADEICVDAWNGDKLFVFALLYYLAVVDNKYLIGVTYRLEPVSDHDDGLVARQSLDGLLQPVLIFRVYVGRGLVPISTTSANPHKTGTFQKSKDN